MAYKYNALGLQATTTVIIDNRSYVTGSRFDRQGNMTNLVYPDSSEVQYGYNTAGQPETVEQKESAGSFGYIISDFDYGPHGQVTFKVFGNSASTTYTFDAAKLYRLTNILTIASSSQMGEMGFGGGGEEMLLAGTAIRHPLAIAMLDIPEISEITQPLDGLRGGNRVEVAVPIVSPSIPSSDPSLQDPAPDVPVSSPDLMEIPVPQISPDTSISSVDDLLDGVMPTIVPIATEAENAQADFSELLKGKSPAERANIKGVEIAKLGPIARTARKNYDIEIVSIEAIDGGAQAFVRAWNANGQIGFGTDGTVEIERFRIFNPPILVPDPSGDIVRSWDDPLTGEHGELHYREDLQEALLQVLEHNLSVMENIHTSEGIISGKIGNTTSTFYSDTGDGHIESEIAGFNWDAAHDASSGTQTNYTGTFSVSGSYRTGGGHAGIVRAFQPFDTAALTDTDVIDSATLSVYPTSILNGDNDGDDWINVVQTTQASTASLVDDDFDQNGDAINNPTEGATRIDLGVFPPAPTTPLR